MSAFVFLFWLVVLIIEGSLLAALILRSKMLSPLTISLGLPLAALCNAIIVFVCTMTTIPLTFVSMLIGHAVIIGIFGFMRKKWGSKIDSTIQSFSIINFPFSIRIICITLLAIHCAFSFAHSVILPTYHIDSLTNWTMRSKVSFYDRAIAFDATEVRGVAKPQYPILFHALQITVNEGNAEWSDRSANAIHFFLTLSSLIALFLLIKRKKGLDQALVCITLITGIPLLTLHLSQGYGDLPLVLFLCLSFIALWLSRAENDAKWLMLSGLFMAAGVWTKSEGLFVGLIPWIAFVSLDVRNPDRRRQMMKPAIIGVITAIIFPFFLLTQGLGLTPHGSDARLEWHPEILDDILSGLFASGSMGIVWYAIAICSALLLLRFRKKDESVDESAMILGLWALFSLLLIIGTYVFTPNAAFVANGESYYRQLMIPASLFFLWFVASFKSPSSLPSSEQA